MILKIEELTKRFGGVQALTDIEMTVPAGGIHGLIGPNGSGKSTLFNVISGFYKPTAGKIIFQDLPIAGLRSDQVARIGIARTFQNLRLFRTMTVLENVLVGTGMFSQVGPLDIFIHPKKTLQAEAEKKEMAMHILQFMGLSQVANEIVVNLPYGMQKLVEIARAYSGRPKLLLLDEPAAGLNNTETKNMREIFFKIRDEETTILLVEHDMKLVMEVCNTVTVLNFGRKIAHGTPETVSHDPVVIEAYLGKGA